MKEGGRAGKLATPLGLLCHYIQVPEYLHCLWVHLLCCVYFMVRHFPVCKTMFLFISALKIKWKNNPPILLFDYNIINIVLSNFLISNFVYKVHHCG